MEWDREKNLKFIESYRIRPSLWNPTHSEYKSKRKRHEALIELCSEFGIDKSEVEKKIKNLQTQFTKEIKKIKYGSNDYTSKWYAFKPLAFLGDKNKPTALNVDDFIESESDDNSRHIELPKRKRYSDENTSKVNKAFSILNTLYEERKELDEYVLFGQQIAIKLKKLPNDRARTIVQHRLSKILYEAELFYNYDSLNGNEEMENNMEFTAEFHKIEPP